MTKYLLIAGTLFILVGFIKGFAVYRPSPVSDTASSTPYESCEDYTIRIKKEIAAVMARGFTDYHVVDSDKYECKNEPKPTYVPNSSPTPFVPLSSPVQKSSLSP